MAGNWVWKFSQVEEGRKRPDLQWHGSLQGPVRGKFGQATRPWNSDMRPTKYKQLDIQSTFAWWRLAACSRNVAVTTTTTSVRQTDNCILYSKFFCGRPVNILKNQSPDYPKTQVSLLFSIICLSHCLHGDMQPPVSGHFDVLPRVSACGRFDCIMTHMTLLPDG